MESLSSGKQRPLKLGVAVPGKQRPLKLGVTVPRQTAAPSYLGAAQPGYLKTTGQGGCLRILEKQQRPEWLFPACLHC